MSFVFRMSEQLLGSAFRSATPGHRTVVGSALSLRVTCSIHIPLRSNRAARVRGVVSAGVGLDCTPGWHTAPACRRLVSVFIPSFQLWSIFSNFLVKSASK